MLVAILQTCTAEELEEDLSDEEDTLIEPSSPTLVASDDEMSEEKRQAVKAKILAIGRMSRVFTLMRDESEKNSELKSLRIDTDASHLADGAEVVKESIHGWKEARVSDIENERLPPELIDVSSPLPVLKGEAMMTRRIVGIPTRPTNRHPPPRLREHPRTLLPDLQSRARPNLPGNVRPPLPLSHGRTCLLLTLCAPST